MNNRKSFKTKFALLLVFSLAGARMSAAENPLPLMGVTFSTTDKNLQKLYNRSEAVEQRNIIQFTPTMKTLFEGGDYPNCYLETQPMGGEMYAARDPQIALNNQLIFLLMQRSNGRLPGMVRSFLGHPKDVPSGTNAWLTWFPDQQVTAHYGWFQGLCFPEPAWRTYFWIGKGTRVPLYIRAPRLTASGSSCETPVSGIDFFPTLVELGGVTSAPKQTVDGVSLVPLLKGGKLPPRPLFWHYPHYGNQGGKPSTIIRSGDWKLIHYWEDGHNELYNLAADIGEQQNLAATETKRAAELWSQLQT